MKRFLKAAGLALGLFWASAASATCDITSSFTAGQVLTAAQLNTLVTDSEACSDNIINGDTFTGNMLWHSGVDALFYSDTGSTLTAGVYGDSGRIRGYQDRPGVYNINIKSATTTNAGDSVTVECGNESCSDSNPGYVVMNSGTTGDLVVFRVTADVTQLLTGAHWGIGTTGDITGALIRALFVNDNGTLRTCFALLGGRSTVLTTDTNATQTNINLPEEVLCNTAVASATNTVLEYGFFRSNFDDTGGAAEDLWANQTGVGDFVTGRTADGYWQPWNPVFAGFSSNPTITSAMFTQIGRVIYLFYQNNSSGTSNATTFTMTAPAKARVATTASLVAPVDNSANVASGVVVSAIDSATLSLYKSAYAAWTGSGTKSADFSMFYNVGPAASFIE